MTAAHMRRTILDAFLAYETSDRKLIESLIADEFSFTSPYDDAIDREAYFARCWPNNEVTARIQVERIFVEGNAAYVTYLFTKTSGRQTRNTEYMVFNGGKLASVHVYFGAEYENGRMLKATPG